jgi:hypothetical protein
MMREYKGLDGHTYLVYSSAEANKACREYIRKNLWAFRPEWLVRFVPVSQSREFLKAIADSIRAIQQKLSENANETIFAMISKNFATLVREAIASDGRGHFLSSYDGQERESGTIPGLPSHKFAYRID